MDATLRSIVAAVVGLAVGSFLTVVVDRVPQKQSVIAPRSRCPSCGAAIADRDNVPVISYLLLRGRCRSCGDPIPAFYPLLETLTAVLFVAVARVYSSLPLAAGMSAFVAVMLALAAIDLRLHLIPNRITYPALAVFAVAVPLGLLLDPPLDPLRGLAGAAIYGGGFLIVALIAPRGLGMGDVKLAALIGIVCGSLGLRFVGVAAGVAIVAGGLGGIVALLSGRGRKSAIPFGPYLAGGAVAAVLWGERIADWYLRSLH